MDELSLTQFKVCTQCGCTKAATAEFFRRFCRSKDGLRATCKVCASVQDKLHRQNNREALNAKNRHWYQNNSEEVNARRRARYQNDPDETKARNRRYQQTAPAKKKAAAASRRYYQNNREKCIEASMRWYRRNREKEAQRKKRWSQENPARLRQRRRQYAAENKEKISNYKRHYYQANKERYRAYVQNRRALRAEAQGNHTFDDVWDLLERQHHACYYCTTPLFGAYHVDHMTPLVRGGSNAPENLAIACPTCNLSKHTKTAEEFLEKGGEFYSN